MHTHAHTFTIAEGVKM